MRNTIKSALVGIGLSILPFVVVAAEEDPQPYGECKTQATEADTQAAKGAFAAGQAAYNEGDYDRAITYWTDAYRRDCSADALLRNLATAYELSGKKKHSVMALETYLARVPDSPARDQIQRKIELLRQKIVEESATPTATAPTSTAAPTGTATSTALPPDGGDEPGGSKPIVPLIVAGAGGLLAIVGTVVYLGGNSDLKDVEKQCPSRKNCPPSVSEDGNSARSRVNIGGALAIVGIAAGAGGLIWYLASPSENAAAALPGPRRARSSAKLPRVAPAVGPGFAGLSIAGSF